MLAIFTLGDRADPVNRAYNGAAGSCPDTRRTPEESGEIPPGIGPAVIENTIDTTRLPLVDLIVYSKL